jgi:hypothetical protein
VGGQPAITPEAETGLMLSPGSGSVTIDANLIRGNLAGAGDGGGIRIERVNGQDIPQAAFSSPKMMNRKRVPGLVDAGMASTC